MGDSAGDAGTTADMEMKSSHEQPSYPQNAVAELNQTDNDPTQRQNRESSQMSRRKESHRSKKYVNFNVSGQRFTVSKDLLQKFPSARMALTENLEEYWSNELNAYYFDRDPQIFNVIMNLYRYNKEGTTSNIDKALLDEELSFWKLELPENSEEDPTSESALEKEFLDLENRIRPPLPDSTTCEQRRFKMWCFITDPVGPYTEYPKLALLYACISIAMILLYMILFGLSTKAIYREKKINGSDGTEIYVHPSCKIKLNCLVGSQPVPFITYSLHLISLFFLLETIAKIIFCHDHKFFFTSTLNWLDIITTLCSVISTIVSPIEEPTDDVNVSIAVLILRAIQSLRIFKFFQYVTVLDGLLVMLLTIKASAYELVVLMTYVVIAMFFFSTVVMLAEISLPVGNGIPDCLIGYWWAVITMTTVGYGDYYPESTGGHFIGVFCAITGLIMTALPVAVIGNNFTTYWDHNKSRKQKMKANKKRQDISLIPECCRRHRADTNTRTA